MSTYNTSDFRSGLKILLDSDPFTIVEIDPTPFRRASPLVPSIGPVTLT